MEKFAGYIDYRWSEKVWWGEAPEGPCDCSKEIREYLKELVREACRRAEPWPSDKPRLGVPNGITSAVLPVAIGALRSRWVVQEPRRTKPFAYLQSARLVWCGFALS